MYMYTNVYIYTYIYIYITYMYIYIYIYTSPAVWCRLASARPKQSFRPTGTRHVRRNHTQFEHVEIGKKRLIQTESQVNEHI